MNKALRSTDFSADVATPLDLEDAFFDSNLNRLVSGFPERKSAVQRAAQLEVSRFDAAAKVQPPASANGEVSSATSVSETETPKEIGEDLQTLAGAKDFFRSFSMNPVSPKARPATFSPIQEWEGYVVDVVGDHMVANLVDLTAHHKFPTSRVEIPLEELDSVAAKRLRPGLIFRWAIGYLRSPGGSKSRYSNIVFRDLPQWTKNELITAKKQAAEMAEYFARPDNESNVP
jgi:hypothetical protein